jgi:hypothetical protein
MAWTAPRTWTDGELVTAAIMNPHVRDNMLAVGPHLIARKTSDQSVTSSAVLVDDSNLQLTVAANEVWLLHYVLRWEASAAGDIQVTFSFPTSGRIDAVAATNDTGQVQGWGITTSNASPTTWNGGGAGVVRLMTIDGTYIGAGNAGTIILRWAQAASDGTATKVLAQSTLWAVKLA